LIPLLSGQVVVNRLLVEGVDLLAETDKNGVETGNFPELNRQNQNLLKAAALRRCLRLIKSS